MQIGQIAGGIAIGVAATYGVMRWMGYQQVSAPPSKERYTTGKTTGKSHEDTIREEAAKMEAKLKAIEEEAKQAKRAREQAERARDKVADELQEAKTFYKEIVEENLQLLAEYERAPAGGPKRGEIIAALKKVNTLD